MTVLISDILANVLGLSLNVVRKSGWNPWFLLPPFVQRTCGTGYAQPLPASMTSDMASAVRESGESSTLTTDVFGISWMETVISNHFFSNSWIGSILNQYDSALHWRKYCSLCAVRCGAKYGFETRFSCRAFGSLWESAFWGNISRQSVAFACGIS